MPPRKLQTKQDILRAISVTRSNKAASRYLNIDYNTYRQYAQLYIDEETGKTLFELHKNQYGVGIPKLLQGRWRGKVTDKSRKKGTQELKLILSGDITTIDDYDINTFKERLIIDAILKEKCIRCGFDEARVIDYKVPLLLNFRDGNRKNWRLDNIELVCYNCYYLTVGDVFTKKQIKDIESHIPTQGGGVVEWDLDPYMREHLKSLGLGDDEPDEEDDFTSYKDYVK